MRYIQFDFVLKPNLQCWVLSVLDHVNRNYDWVAEKKRFYLRAALVLQGIDFLRFLSVLVALGSPVD